MIFVTGGTGLVGAHLLYDLVSRGEKVRALKRPGSSIHRTKKIFSYYSKDYLSLLQNIDWVEGDILDKDRMQQLLAGMERIYHAAAMISFDPRDRDTMIHNNCEGTANLVDLALLLRIPRFCHVSSISAIGSPPEGIEANEDHPWRNNRDHSAYSESKYLSEMEVWRGCFQGLDAVIVNPSVIIGPDNWKSGSSILFFKVWKGLKFYTKGGTGFVDVRDVTKAMQRLMADDVWEKAKNQRYILNAENIPFRKFFGLISDCLQVKRPNILVGDLLLNLAWRLSALKSFLTRTPPSITRETARSANKSSYYDGSKICRAIGFEYTPARVSIQNISVLFLKDINSK
jgi:dihydroflavonol-4-reductase